MKPGYPCTPLSTFQITFGLGLIIKCKQIVQFLIYNNLIGIGILELAHSDFNFSLINFYSLGCNYIYEVIQYQTNLITINCILLLELDVEKIHYFLIIFRAINGKGI